MLRQFQMTEHTPAVWTVVLAEIKTKVKLSRNRYASVEGESKGNSHLFLTSALDGASGQRHAPAALYLQEWTLGTHCIGGWVAGLDTQATGKKSSASAGVQPLSSSLQ
jgi:hypothetical protein